jgi:hypothetical protein
MTFSMAALDIHRLGGCALIAKFAFTGGEADILARVVDVSAN